MKDVRLIAKDYPPSESYKCRTRAVTDFRTFSTQGDAGPENRHFEVVAREHFLDLGDGTR